jgi:uncharacterized phage infection (PIP) family protein YhgE
VVDREQ